MSNLIKFEGHTTVVGLTQSGKTYTTLKSLQEHKGGVLFFNTKLETKMLNGFTQASRDNQFGQIEAALRQGKKVNYKPQFSDTAYRDKEMVYLVENLHDGRKKDLLIVVDEVHLFGKKATDKLVNLVTTGLSFGIRGVWISQRPANVDNTLMTQSDKFVIFKTNMEQAYFERYKMPAEEIKRKIEEGGQHNFVVYDWQSLKGPFKA